MANKMDRAFRLLDFNIYNTKPEQILDSSEEENDENKKGSNQFTIQMFGINETGEQCSIIVNDFNPFFYVKVDDDWTIYTKTSFVDYIKKRIGYYYAASIGECKLIKRKKLYGFDGGKEYKFILLSKIKQLIALKG